jgi:hypothetical protein
MARVGLIRRDLGRHKIAIAFAALAIGLGWALLQIGRQADRNAEQARTNHAVLCALQADIMRRRDTSVEYLEEHPRGVVSPVTRAVIITPAELQRGIDSQTSTLEALERGGLHCG